jgi:CMP-N-acetylneuraminic acid synthetase|tara:strand:- start:838 stop:1596 length:759 start_codon:yes stop_codon:yes gene_type:complete
MSRFPVASQKIVSEMNVLAMVPARGGSKRFPGKNIALLEGKPLLAYSIEAAFACENIDRVVVSTEDDAIAQVAQDFGAEVVDRPVELATDETYIGLACKHALLEIERRDNCRYDVHVLLQPTSPFRTAEHIHAGLRLFSERECDSVLSVRLVSDHPYWMRVIEDVYLQPFLGSKIGLHHQRKQELPTLYCPNGALYITYRDTLLDTGEVLGERTLPFVMTREESVDVDGELDLILAEVLMRRFQRKATETVS